MGDLWFATGLTVSLSGDIFVPSGGAVVTRDLVFRVDPRSGKRTILSDFDDAAQGPLGVALNGIALHADLLRGEEVLVTAADPNPGTVSLFGVDPRTGRRRIVSSSSDTSQGPTFYSPSSIAVAPLSCWPRCRPAQR